ncbi:MAG: transporter substrate-binding domain-containing protein [Ketobacteraceae bacterium]|nr:transporter substrate-binding domain-containing protein [Ketobacteraceae bacterium]
MRPLKIVITILLFNISSNALPTELFLVGASDFPPYTSREFKDNGFLCKIISESFAMEGIEVKYQFLPAKRALQQAKAGRIAGVVGSYSTPEFEKYFYISDSLIIDTVSFFYLISSNFEWNTFSDLRVGLVGGTLGYNYGKEFQDAEMSGIINVQRASRNALNFKLLLHKRIRAFPMSTLPGYVLLHKNFSESQISQITNHSRPVHSTHIYLLLTKKNPKNKEYIVIFNKSLSNLKASGRYDIHFDETLRYIRETYVASYER